jgi:hypothetical protein
MTTLEAATEKILSAIRAADFRQIEEASRERARLLSGGAEVTLRGWELGEEARQALRSLKTRLVLEFSRLERIRQIAQSFPPERACRREYFG